MDFIVTSYENTKKDFNIPKGNDISINSDSLIEITEKDIIRTERYFPGRAKGVIPGIYSFTNKNKHCVGDYINFVQWRNNLLRFKGYLAFQELISFNEFSVIMGPVVAKKLSKDFAIHEEEAKEFVEEGKVDKDWLLEYQRWKNIFDMAANNGFVCFK